MQKMIKSLSAFNEKDFQHKSRKEYSMGNKK